MNRDQAIRALEAVSSQGSFTAAAESLACSKSQISKQVGWLERRIGVRLLRRSTRHVSVTDEGRQYLDEAVDLLDSLDALDDRIGGEASAPTGRLRISVGVSYGTRKLGPVLGDFGAAYPGISLDVRLNDRAVALLDEGVDAAVRVGALEDSSLVARPIGSVGLRVCASPRYLATRGTPRSIRDLTSHNCLLFEYFRTPHEWQFDRGTVRVRVDGDMRANNGEILVQAAVAGRGIVLQPDFLVDEAIAAGLLVPMFEDAGPPELPVNVLYPDGSARAARIGIFADFLARS